VGTDLARLDTELAKFGAYLAREPEGKRVVTAELVTLLVGQSREEAAWEVQEAVLGGRPAQAVRKVRELVEISQAPEQLILWSLVDLARKLHDAARMLGEGASEGTVSKQVKLWGPSMGPTLRAARLLAPRRAFHATLLARKDALVNVPGMGDSITEGTLIKFAARALQPLMSGRAD
jgi:DNA polymerase III delta subunit